MSFQGTLPIIVDGERIGVLNVRQEGLYTVFSGSCRDTGGLLRLSVYGNSEGYLGTMLPQKGGLAIEKRLSRAAMAAFPTDPQFAGPAGLGNSAGDPLTAGAEENTQARPEEAAVRTAPNPAITENTPAIENTGTAENTATAENTRAPESPAAEKEPRTEADSENQKAQDEEQSEEDDTETSPEPITYWRVLPNPWSLLGGMANKSALTNVRGALTTVENDRRLIALLPEEVQKLGDIGVYAPAKRRTIDGTDYVIFEVVNGKLS